MLVEPVVHGIRRSMKNVFFIHVRKPFFSRSKSRVVAPTGILSADVQLYSFYLPQGYKMFA